jgi:hypothetical protein
MLSPLADLAIRISFGTLEISNIKGLQRVKMNREFHRTLIQCMPMKVRAYNLLISEKVSKLRDRSTERNLLCRVLRNSRG